MTELENMIFLGIFTIAPIAIFGLIFGKRMFKKRRYQREDVRSRSLLWLLLPIFGGIFGGLIAYGVIGHDDPKKSRICLIIGFFPTIGLIAGLWITWFIY